jgi:flagellar biosynthesis anti-sigma factor FlgM
MRIDANRSTAETHAPSRTDSGAKGAGRGGAAAQGIDRVDVSSEAKRVREIVANAVQAASTAPEIRQSAVARARQLLASGELGQDSTRLASAIIDDLLDQP